jgi:pentatricopeptide repeat protein
LERVRADWPDTPTARVAAYTMVDCYVQLQRYEEAKSLLAELHTSLPKEEESLRVLISNYLGGLSEELGENESALAYYLEASRLVAQSKAVPQAVESFQATLLSSLGRVYLALGRTDEAKNTYIQLSASYPGSAEAYIADFKLKELSAAGSIATSPPAATQPTDDPSPATPSPTAPDSADPSAASTPAAPGQAGSAAEDSPPDNQDKVQDNGAASSDTTEADVSVISGQESGLPVPGADSDGKDPEEITGPVAPPKAN